MSRFFCFVEIYGNTTLPFSSESLLFTPDLDGFLYVFVRMWCF